VDGHSAAGAARDVFLVCTASADEHFAAVTRTLFLLLLFTGIELSLCGSSPYTSTDKTNKNKYT
jgi:hypothetical protein